MLTMVRFPLRPARLGFFLGASVAQTFFNDADVFCRFLSSRSLDRVSYRNAHRHANARCHL